MIMAPAVLSTKECHEYVGGRPTWEELMKCYGQGRNPILKPFRRTPDRGASYWLREVVDDVLRRAQMEQTLVSPTSG